MGATRSCRSHRHSRLATSQNPRFGAGLIDAGANPERWSRRSRALLLVQTISGDNSGCHRQESHFDADVWLAFLEPISKSPEEDNEASELYEAEEVVGVVFPTDEDAALPVNPSKEALHEPASHIAA